MKIELELVDPPEHHMVEFDARDQRAFERSGARDIGGPAVVRGDVTMGVSLLTWVGWHALHRQGMTNLTYAAFEARCITAKSEDDETAAMPDPTVPATSAD